MESSLQKVHLLKGEFLVVSSLWGGFAGMGGVERSWRKCTSRGGFVLEGCVLSWAFKGL